VSATCAAIYLLVSAGAEGRKAGILQVLGLSRLIAGLGQVSTKVKVEEKEVVDEKEKANGHANGNGKAVNGTTGVATKTTPWYQTLPALLMQVSLFQTIAGPIGFIALKHISYPTMVLGKVRSSDNRPLTLPVVQAYSCAPPQRPTLPPSLRCPQVLRRRTRVGWHLHVHALW
jgi:hypothetical protein